jgi:hypothetical protein
MRNGLGGRAPVDFIDFVGRLDSVVVRAQV